jgi:Sel1 repeat-containing protein
LSANADLALEIGDAAVALVGMSRSRGTVEATLPKPGASGRADVLSSADDGDWGEPVFDLPLLIEPIEEPFGEPFVPPPPDRNLLAPADPAETSAPTETPAPAAPPEPKESLALQEETARAEPQEETAPAEPREETARAEPQEETPSTEPREETAPVAPPQRVEPVATPAAPAEPDKASARWLAKAKIGPILQPLKHRPLRTAGAALAAVIILVLAAFVAGIGPFARVHSYPTALAPKDPAQRLAYFQRGAQAGDPNAEMQLAIIYAKGDGVAQDYTTAATWFRAAGNSGVARAQFDLGVMYERGRGVPVDLTQATDWYLKAAQGGFPLAQYNLAVCYTKGQGVRKDLTEAALWYHRAAAQGVVPAMINLAVLYDKGDGVTASPSDAYAWYQAAGKRGDQDSARRATDVYNGMAKLDQIHAEALASDVANSIHDPAPDIGETAAGAPNPAEH